MVVITNPYSNLMANYYFGFYFLVGQHPQQQSMFLYFRYQVHLIFCHIKDQLALVEILF